MQTKGNLNAPNTRPRVLLGLPDLALGPPPWEFAFSKRLCTNPNFLGGTADAYVTTNCTHRKTLRTLRVYSLGRSTLPFSNSVV